MKTEKVETTKSTKVNPVKEFFARKYDSGENILTIFKSPRIIGAILGEVIGTMLIVLIFLTLGFFNPLYTLFGVMAVTIAVYAFSGANLNPTITVGLMASRRISAIRGTLYIISQFLGAFLALIIVQGFHGAAPEGAMPIPAVTALEGNDMFWPITMLELLGAAILGFTFARALVYKRSVFTFGAVVAGGFLLATLIAVVITGNFYGIQTPTFVMNPAAAFMYQVMPSSAENFGALMGEVGLALTTYVVFPVIGGILGFYISDIAMKLSGQKLAE